MVSVPTDTIPFVYITTCVFVFLHTLSFPYFDCIKIYVLVSNVDFIDSKLFLVIYQYKSWIFSFGHDLCFILVVLKLITGELCLPIIVLIAQ